MSATTYEDVIKFWFKEKTTVQEKFKLWYGGGPELDELLRTKFGDLIEKARNGELSSWSDMSNGPVPALAVVILIDQFCRSVFRGTSKAHSHDPKALEVAKSIIDSGKYKDLTAEQRSFNYLPFMHAEDKAMQERSVQLYKELLDEVKGTPDEKMVQGGYDFALQHQEVVGMFGRFPKRNAPLGRENTSDEEEYLKSNKHMF